MHRTKCRAQQFSAMLYDDLARQLLVTVIPGPPCGPLTCKYYIGQARITFETHLSILSTRFCCRVHLFEVLIISPAVKFFSVQLETSTCAISILYVVVRPVCLSLRRQKCKDRLLRPLQRSARFRLLDISPVDHFCMTTVQSLCVRIYQSVAIRMHSLFGPWEASTQRHNISGSQ
jgi:hypothetical protein